MATPKPNKTYVRRPVSIYLPADAEVDTLVERLSEITETNLDNTFRETLRRILTLLRGHLDIRNRAPAPNALYTELQQLKTAIKPIHRIFNQAGGMSESLHHMFMPLIMRHELTEVNNPFEGLQFHVHNLMILCEELEKELPPKPKRPSATQFRDQMLIELARALNEAGYKPLSTAEGKFGECVEAFLEAVPYEMDGRAIGGKVCTAHRNLVLKVVKQYPNTLRYSLLDMAGLFERFKDIPALGETNELTEPK